MAEVLAEIAIKDPQHNEETRAFLKGMVAFIEKYPDEIDDLLKKGAGAKQNSLYSNNPLNMFCSNCGTEYNIETTNFCHKCGTSVAKTLPSEVNKNPQIAFYKIGTTKLIVLSVVTLWIFEFYWFYKNWKSIREQDSQSPNPLLGTVFFPIAAYGLFKRILVSAKEKGYKKSYPAGWLALGFFILTYIGGQMWSEEVLQYANEGEWWLFVIAIYVAQPLILTPIQKAINYHS